MYPLIIYPFAPSEKPGFLTVNLVVWRHFCDERGRWRALEWVPAKKAIFLVFNFQKSPHIFIFEKIVY